jgi:acyl-CoA hydrolase
MNPYEDIVERRTQLVFPQDANILGTLFGGKAVAMMDEVGAIVAMRACRKAVVTASIGRTSLTAQVELWAEEPATGRRRLSTTGSLIFVAVDKHEKPTPIWD